MDKLALIEQTAILDTHKSICGLTVFKASVDESIEKAFTSYAYALATKTLKEMGIKKDFIITVKEAYNTIRETPKAEVSEEQKNFIRATVNADIVAIICNHEEEPKTKRIKALWESKGTEVILIECDEWTEHNSNIWTLSKYTDEERQRADNLARLYGFTLSAPCYREPKENDITMYASRHDTQTMRRIEPKHCTKITTSRRKYKAYFESLASDEEIDRIYKEHEYVQSLDEKDRPLFYDIDMTLCECGKAHSLNQFKDNRQNITNYIICPYCEKKTPRRTFYNIEFPIEAF